MASPTTGWLFERDHLQWLFGRLSHARGLERWIGFGLLERWRRAAVNALALQPGMVVGDLMCGAGENWDQIARRIGPGGRIVAIDFCTGMLARAPVPPRVGCTVLHRDVCDTSLPDASLDAAVCTFGLKTLSPRQRQRLAAELTRILKPGGRFAFVELALPAHPLRRWVVRTYLRLVTHAAAWVRPSLLPHTWLVPYLDGFVDPALPGHGLAVQTRILFGGCALSVTGIKPGASIELWARR